MNKKLEPTQKGMTMLAEYCLMKGAALLKAYYAFDPEGKGLSENAFCTVIFAEAMKMGLTHEQYSELLEAFKKLTSRIRKDN